MRKLILFALFSVGIGAAQQTTIQTTLSASLTANMSNSTVCLTSATGVQAPATNQTGLFIDREFFFVAATTPSSSCFSTIRGYNGTSVQAHNSGAVVWVGPLSGTSIYGNDGASPFRASAPQGGPGSPCTATSQLYLPQIAITGAFGGGPEPAIWNCNGSPGVWVRVSSPFSAGSGTLFYNVTDTGANNALVVSVPGLPQSKGACMSINLAHTLQAGANTIALNGATAVSLKSSKNDTSNIGTAYAATGTLNTCFDGTAWVDMSQ